MEQKTNKKLHIGARLFAATRPYRRTLWLTVFLSIFLAVLGPVRPWLIQISVDRYIANNLLYGLMVVSAIHFGALVLESLLRFYFLYRINWLGQRVVNDIRKSVFQKIIGQSNHYFDTTPIGTLTTRTINDMEALNDVFAEGIISIVADILMICAIIGTMLYTDWRLTLVCLTTFPLLLIATYFFKESVRKSFQRVRNAVAALNTFVQEHLSGMYIVQVFAAENKESKKFREINKEHRNANINAIFAYSVFFPVVEIILALSLGLLVWYGARQMIGYDVTPGVIVSFILYLNLLFRPLRMLADKFNVLQMGVVAAERVYSVLDHRNVEQNSGSYQPAQLRGEISFRDVTFGYSPEKTVLQHLSFEVRAGSTVAIVGPTGAGKSSIISLLNRQYEVSSGKILMDGTDIRDYDLDYLRRHIGLVLQDVFLFSGSIFENITLRNPRISLEAVIDVCRLLGIDHFIESLPGGYYFKVMERGGSLSQGQRQLLSFARALIYNPSILILDEATASVDSESEQLIQKAIDKMIRGRTSIVIAHRLSTIRKAEKIIVLQNGQIAEQGSYQQLLDLGGIYAGLEAAAMSQQD